MAGGLSLRRPHPSVSSGPMVGVGVALFFQLVSHQVAEEVEVKSSDEKRTAVGEEEGLALRRPSAWVSTVPKEVAVAAAVAASSGSLKKNGCRWREDDKVYRKKRLAVWSSVCMGALLRKGCFGNLDLFIKTGTDAGNDTEKPDLHHYTTPDKYYCKSGSYVPPQFQSFSYTLLSKSI